MNLRGSCPPRPQCHLRAWEGHNKPGSPFERQTLCFQHSGELLCNLCFSAAIHGGNMVLFFYEGKHKIQAPGDNSKYIGI